MDIAQTAASGAQTQSNAARSTLSENFDTFLLLLTTQLQNQDPTNPVDSEQFTQQLVQYSQVEQQILTNETLSSLAASQTAASASAALSYLGRAIDVESPRAVLADGEAAWTYELAAPASDVTLIVRDAAGREIGRAEGERRAGAHQFVWNGETASGADAPDGVYSLEIQALDENGDAISVRQLAQARVTRIETGADGVSLLTPIGAFDIEDALAISQ